MAWLAALALAAPLAAAEPDSAEYASCMEASGGVTVAVLECIGHQVTVQDARLNQAYRAALALLTPARQAQLRAAQRLWIQYRDANCAFYADPDGGSLARIEANSCVLEATADRARELQALAEAD